MESRVIFGDRKGKAVVVGGDGDFISTKRVRFAVGDFVSENDGNKCGAENSDKGLGLASSNDKLGMLQLQSVVSSSLEDIQKKSNTIEGTSNYPSGYVKQSVVEFDDTPKYISVPIDFNRSFSEMRSKDCHIVGAKGRSDKGKGIIDESARRTIGRDDDFGHVNPSIMAEVAEPSSNMRPMQGSRGFDCEDCYIVGKKCQSDKGKAIIDEPARRTFGRDDDFGDVNPSIMAEVAEPPSNMRTMQGSRGFDSDDCFIVGKKCQSDKGKAIIDEPARRTFGRDDDVRDVNPSRMAEAAEPSNLRILQGTRDFELEKCTGLNKGCANTDEGDKSLKDCSCSFCLKAAYIWSDLYCQDAKGRIKALRKSKKSASILVQNACKEAELQVGSSSTSSKLETELSGQWRSLFMHMEDMYQQEINQIQKEVLALTQLNEDCKIDLENANKQSDDKKDL